MALRERNVTGILVDPDGTPITNASILFTLDQSLGYTDTHIVVDKQVSTTTDLTGAFSASLWCDEDSLRAVDYTVMFPDANSGTGDAAHTATFRLDYEDGSDKGLGQLIAASATPPTIVTADNFITLIDSRIAVSSLDDLGDVVITAIADGDGLVWDAATSKWVNAAGGGGGGATNLNGLSDVVITSPASGEVLRHNGTNWVDAALTKSDVGLSNVDNTADTAKPVSTAQQTALDTKQPDIQFKDEGVNAGTAGGVTAVDFVGAGVSASEAAGVLTVTISGGGGGGGATTLDELTDVVITSPASGHMLKHNGTNFVNVAPVKGDVGLGNVDNTSDAAKPVSTAQQTALDLKADLASPTLTGTPAAPTAAPGTNTTQISTTAFVQAAIAALINAAPGALDTLDELAAALGDDANFATTMTTALATKLVKASNLSDLTDAAAARTNLGLVIGTNVQAYSAALAQLAGLGDPGADRLVFWDESANSFAYLTLGTNLTITGTTLDAAGGGGGTATAVQVAANPGTNAQGYFGLTSTGRLYVGTATDVLSEIPTANTTGSSANQVMGLNAANNAFETKTVSGANGVSVSHAANSIVIGGVDYVKGASIESPTGAEDISLFFTDVAITISKMVAVLNGSATPSVTWTIRHSTDRNAAGNEVVTGGTTTTSTTTGSVVTSFNDATIPANSFVWLETTAQSGTVTQLNISIKFQED
jgi:hypothetical protein